MSVRLCVVCGDDLPDVHRSHRRYCRARCRMRALRIRDRDTAQVVRVVTVDDLRARRQPRWEPPAEPDQAEIEPEDPPSSDAETAAERDRPTPQQFGAYQALFDHFNHLLFDDSLPSVLLTFSNHTAQGYFKPGKWEDGQGVTHEIGMNPHLLRSRPRQEIAAALVHDMCHLWQQVYGHPGRLGYHSRQWSSKMQELGLVPSDTGQPGGRATGQHMEQWIDPHGAFHRALGGVSEEHWLPWQRSTAVESGSPPPLPTKHKYSCPNDHGNVWGKPRLWLVCGHCDAQFVESSLGRISD